MVRYWHLRHRASAPKLDRLDLRQRKGFVVLAMAGLADGAKYPCLANACYAIQFVCRPAPYDLYGINPGHIIP